MHAHIIMFRFGSLSLGALGLETQDADSRDLFVGYAHYHCQIRRERRNIALTNCKMLRLFPGFELRVPKEILVTT